jgi:type IV fimbrial biogenesis protein FimT
MREEKGFTLIEVIVTIAIVSILAAIAVPSYRYVINSSRVSSDMNSLLGSLQYARAEALKRGLAVVVCASGTSTSKDGSGNPNPTCGTVSTWQVGWFGFVDTNANGSFDTGEEVIAVQGPLASANTFVASNDTRSLRFNREGFVTGLTAPVLISLVPPGTGVASQKRCLSVGFVGRFTVQQPGQGACT